MLETRSLSLRFEEKLHLREVHSDERVSSSNRNWQEEIDETRSRELSSGTTKINLALLT